MENFIVYLHLIPSSDKVFYVGKGRPGRQYSKRGRNVHWHNIVKKHGGFDVDVYADSLTESMAFEIEVMLIKKFGRAIKGGQLANLTEGGDGRAGFGLSGERNGRFGLRLTPEVKKKFGRCNKGDLNPMSGRRHKDSTKRLISEKAVKRYQDGFKNPMLGSSRPDFAEIGRRQSKPVIQKTVRGEIVAEFSSMNDAVRNTGFKLANISGACNGKLKTYMGFIWEFKQRENG